MPYSNGKILMSWSGGKDSAMALYDLIKSREFEVGGLVTAICEKTLRVPQNNISRDMIRLQAESIGLHVEFVYIPEHCTKEIYKQKFAEALKPYKAQGFSFIAYGDLFLDDMRDFREDCSEMLGMQTEFPLWHRCTKDLAISFINAKFKAVITSVNRVALSEDYLCRTFDRAFLADIPVNIDPCGENGEFHTFVYGGPIFKTALSVKSGDFFQRESFSYCDIVIKELPETKLIATGS